MTENHTQLSGLPVERSGFLSEPGADLLRLPNIEVEQLPEWLQELRLVILADPDDAKRLIEQQNLDLIF